MIIRKPTEAELEKVLTLSPQAVFDGTLGEVKTTDEKIKQLVLPLLQKGSHYFIAIEKDTIQGWILVGESKDQFTDQQLGFIYELFVGEEWRGHGISKKLMNKALDHFRQAGFSEVRLSAYAENHAIQLYEKMGFKIRTVSMNVQL